MSLTLAPASDMPCDPRLRSRGFSAILDGFHAGVPSTCWATSSSGSTPPQAPAVGYRIPVVGTGYRLAAGHRLRLVLASDDQNPNFPAHDDLPLRQRRHQQPQPGRRYVPAAPASRRWEAVTRAPGIVRPVVGSVSVR